MDRPALSSRGGPDTPRHTAGHPGGSPAAAGERAGVWRGHAATPAAQGSVWRQLLQQHLPQGR
jgi:hypothetical protein